MAFGGAITGGQKEKEATNNFIETLKYFGQVL
jgi:hypothetical protein